MLCKSWSYRILYAIWLYKSHWSTFFLLLIQLFSFRSWCQNYDNSHMPMSRFSDLTSDYYWTILFDLPFYICVCINGTIFIFIRNRLVHFIQINYVFFMRWFFPQRQKRCERMCLCVRMKPTNRTKSKWMGRCVHWVGSRSCIKLSSIRNVLILRVALKSIYN